MRQNHSLFLVLAGVICTSANAVPPTPQQQAFAQAQALANAAQTGAAATISSGGVATTVNQFNPTYYNSSGNAPESALFQGGNGQPAAGGLAKVNNCQTGVPNPDNFLQQNCDAINFMVKNPATRPHISLPPSLFAPSKAIMTNAPALAAGSLGVTNPSAAGGFTGCTNQTVTPSPTLETCSEFTGTVAQQCTFGRVGLADKFTEYQGDKTNDIYLPQSCDKTVNVSVVQTPYCSVSGSTTGLGQYKIGARLILLPFFDVVFGCSGNALASVTVTISAGMQCHSFGCNSGYYPLVLNFIPGTNAGPVSANLARNYKGVWWETVTVSYNGASNTVTVAGTRFIGRGSRAITASAVPSGTAGIKNVMTSSWVNGCAVQEAAAL